jgi:hypothetical protein
MSEAVTEVDYGMSGTVLKRFLHNDDTLTEEERDAQHELFGGWIGTSCED